jgi:hypothetical protein
MSESLEHHEHAEHAAQHGSKRAALIIAILAAALAICEQQSKQAEMAVSQNSIQAVDSWNQYQAKSIRAAIALDIARVTKSLNPPASPQEATTRADVLQQLAQDQASYEKDPKDGKAAIAERAHKYEEARQYSLERAHTYDNASAALQLGIVLATASVITASRLLFRLSLLLGGAGIVLGVLGALAPTLGAF